MNQMPDSIHTRPAKELSSLQIGTGDARYISIAARDDIQQLHDLHLSGELIHITGRGTNSVYGSYGGVVASLDTRGYEWIDATTLRIEGGEDWQQAVDLSVKRNLSGIERLTLIPGTIGAAPVQNIGAFGQLLSNRLVSIEVYDYASNETVILHPEECGFGEHRASRFKNDPLWASYVIMSITLELLPSEHFEQPSGEGLMHFATEQSLAFGTAREAEQLVRMFRATLYPDYTKIPNCGSYFTNFEVSKERAQVLPSEIWEVKHRDARNGTAVLFQCKDLLRSVGIEAGHEFTGGLKMHPVLNNFLINSGDATLEDLIACHDEVNSRLRNAYGITLIPEPELIDDTTVRQER